MKIFKFILVSLMMCLTINISSQTVWTSEMVGTVTANVNGITEYIASDGSNWKVGQRITFGNATGMGVFVHVSMGDGIMTAPQQAPAAWSGKEAEIKKIRISGTKRMGYTLWVTCKGPMQPFHISIEKAIEVGEVVTDGYSSDKALAELKKAKDKLDLGLITIEEFEALKAELSKYIE